MRRLRILRLRLRSLLCWRRVDAELETELQFHLHRQIDQHMAARMPFDEARRAAPRNAS